jgi:hypothetical protein
MVERSQGLMLVKEEDEGIGNLFLTSDYKVLRATAKYGCNGIEKSLPLPVST